MIDPGTVCFFIPPELQKTKLALFMRIGEEIRKLGGRTTRNANDLIRLPTRIIPVIGCSPYLRPLVQNWKVRKRDWIYWDRGYARRVYATWMPRGQDGGYYRWHFNCFQMQRIVNVTGERWHTLRTDMKQWAKNPRGHVVIAPSSVTYEAFHGIQGWMEKTVRSLALITDRQLVIRDKESKRPLQIDLQGAHCMVAHGSIAAVESVLCGCPVVVDPSSAAALVGITDLKQIDNVIFPDRIPWVNSLAHFQFNETELVDGTLWRMLS